MSEVIDAQFMTEPPAIFADETWVRYGETRRIEPTHELPQPLLGNVAVSNTVLRDAYNRMIPLPHYERSERNWIETERTMALLRLTYLQRELGLRALGAPRAAHETGLIDLDANLDTVQLTEPTITTRSFADSTINHTTGVGSMYNPADCPIINIVETKRHFTAQVHAGYKGLRQGVIMKSFDRFKDIYNLSLKDTLVYISPHAISGYEMYGNELDLLAQEPLTRPFLHTNEHGTEFSMAEASLAQLEDAGMPIHHIEVSPINTLSDSAFYSQRARAEKGFNGRNAVVLGMVELT